MKICLIRPPKLMVKDALPIGSQPPLGLALLAGVLKEKGHQVSAIDGISERPKQFNDLNLPVNSERFQSTTLTTMGLSFEEIAEKIPADTDMIGFSSMFSCNWLCD